MFVCVYIYVYLYFNKNKCNQSVVISPHEVVMENTSETHWTIQRIWKRRIYLIFVIFPLTREGEYWWRCQLQISTCQNLCQQLNNHKGICYLPLWRPNSVLLQLLTCDTPCGEFRVQSEALCAPGKLVGQVFR